MSDKISIITVCYNAQDCIEDTIKSVLCQSYHNYQYIIIDGASSDNTMECVEKYKINFSQHGIEYIVCSELDDGIFDAMNKGACMADGDWIIYMNAGDGFVDQDVLKNIINQPLDGYDVVYGDVILRDGCYYRKRLANPLENLLFEMPFYHQCTMTKRSRLLETPFDTQYNYTSDYNFFLHLYLNDGQYLYINQYIAVYEQYGVSDTFDSQKEFVNIQYKNGVIKTIGIKTKLHLFYMKYLLFIREKIRKCFPNIYFSKYRGWYVK